MATITMTKPLVLKSPAFGKNDLIPSKYTRDGAGINPELIIDDVPSDARSLALILDDPDAPSGTFDHWIMWNIPVSGKIAENSAPGVQGRNSKNENKYYGPCPPHGMHHYSFKVYALDQKLDLPLDTDKRDLLNAMKGHILAQGELIGLYKKQG